MPKASSKSREETSGKRAYQYSVDLDPNIVLVVFLSEVYHIDLEHLLLLYDRIRDDFFFFFFLLAGKQITVPKHSKMLKMLGFSKRVCDDIRSGKDPTPVTRQERDVCSRLLELYDKKAKKFVVPMEIKHVAEAEFPVASD